MENNERGSYAPTNVTEWFEKRSYTHKEFSDVKKLARRKRELGLTVSLVLPGRNVADTIGEIVDEINALNEEAPLVEQILVIDADSADGTRFGIAASNLNQKFMQNQFTRTHL